MFLLCVVCECVLCSVLFRDSVGLFCDRLCGCILCCLFSFYSFGLLCVFYDPMFVV